MSTPYPPSILDDPKYRRKFIGYIRKLSVWSPERTATMADARVSPGMYLCCKCKKVVPRKEAQCDHIVPVGRQFVNGELEMWLRKMLCLRSNLQSICKPCHVRKTGLERGGKKKRKAKKRGKNAK